jgi:hypothetical protein
MFQAHMRFNFSIKRCVYKFKQGFGASIAHSSYRYLTSGKPSSFREFKSFSTQSIFKSNQLENIGTDRGLVAELPVSQLLEKLVSNRNVQTSFPHLLNTFSDPSLVTLSLVRAFKECQLNGKYKNKNRLVGDMVSCAFCHILNSRSTADAVWFLTNVLQNGNILFFKT